MGTDIQCVVQECLASKRACRDAPSLILSKLGRKGLEHSSQESAGDASHRKLATKQASGIGILVAEGYTQRLQQSCQERLHMKGKMYMMMVIDGLFNQIMLLPSNIKIFS